MAQAEFILVETDLSIPVTVRETLALAQTVENRERDVFGLENVNVRRPLRGIQIKEETFASLFVSGGGSEVYLRNSSAPPDQEVSYTTNFILQGVTEQRQEKFQPVTTFGAVYGYFFGEQPRMITFNATLLNTADFQWEIEWWANYEEKLRGTRLVDNNVRAFLSYDDKLVEGYIISAATQQNSQTPYEIPLTFTMWVTGVEYLVEPGDKNFPLSSRAALVDFTGAEGIEDELGQFISTTAEVRQRNLDIITSQPTGLLAKLRAGLDKVQDFVGRVGQTIDNVQAFLYGRNLVIPAGFAGSEVYAGRAVFTTGSGFESLQGLELGSGATLNFRLPVNLGAQKAPPVRGTFYDNIDEYPQRAGQQYFTSRGEGTAYANAAAIAGDPTTASSEDLDALATQAAVDAFNQFGIQVDNMEGRSRGVLSRALGRVAFGAVNLGASASGASQAAASLTVGNVVGGGTL